VSQDGRFVYQATDQHTNSGIAIFARATTPTCNAASATVPNATPTNVTLACSDADGDPVTPIIVGSPSHGTLGAVSGGVVTYTPGAAYKGPDSFTFAASDGTNSSAAVTASLTVGGFGGSALASRTLTVDSHFRAKLRVRCAADAPSGKCEDVASLYSAKGRLSGTARKKAVLLGRGRFSVPAGKTVTKRFRLNRAGRKLVRAHKRFPARLSLKATSGAATASRHVYKVKIKRAKTKRKHR
jgi:Bacterial Ig domain